MKTTNNNTRFSSKPARLAILVALMLVTLVAVAIPAAAAEGKAKPEITLAKLKGSWQATVYGEGGCGEGSKLVTFTLNSDGVATDAVWSYHTTGCGDATITGQTFEITTLNSDGSGTATLTIGGGVTLSFSIQVSGSGQVFNLVDITDSGNYEEGTAVKQ